jgi:elongation factor Ts
MAEISAALVKELRDKTAAGIMDCRKALLATGGDPEGAAVWLREKGMLQVAKKAERIAAEGLVALAVDGNTGALIELNTETDFAARNENFQNAARAFVQIALGNDGDHERLVAAAAPEVARLIALLGENVVLRRSAFVSVEDGVVASYLHLPAAPGLGRVGALIALESRGAREPLLEAGRRFAMHVAAASPLWVSVDAIPDDVMAARRLELEQDAAQSGKPAPVIAKIVEGRMRRYLDETVLLRQPWVFDPDQTFEDALHQAEAAVGAPITVGMFAQLKTGEGLEKTSGEEGKAGVAGDVPGGGRNQRH